MTDALQAKYEAIRQGVSLPGWNMDFLIKDFLRSYVRELKNYRISTYDFADLRALIDAVEAKITEIIKLANLFLEFFDYISISNDFCKPETFVKFFEDLLQFYEDEGIVLYTDRTPDLLANDQYRFFNQYLFINFATLAIKNERFDVLAEAVHKRFIISGKGQAASVNYIRFKEYNYTLNEYKNTSSPKRISLTADYIIKSSPLVKEDLVAADILLYYLSYKYHGDDFLDKYWYPELSTYNQRVAILPKLVSKDYFESFKQLFEVADAEGFKKEIAALKASNDVGRVYLVPAMEDGLMVDKIGSIG